MLKHDTGKEWIDLPPTRLQTCEFQHCRFRYNNGAAYAWHRAIDHAALLRLMELGLDVEGMDDVEAELEVEYLEGI